MVEGRNTFRRYEIAITRAVHEANIMNKRYPVYDPDLMPSQLRVQKEGVPNYRHLKQLLEKVGKNYGWDRREEYHFPEKREAIRERIEAPESQRFSFWAGKKEVGGAIIANIEPDVASIFRAVSNTPEYRDLTDEAAQNTLEIYKIGLYPEFTRNGLGGYFLGTLLERLFNDASSPDAVYLNTRSTNHNGVVSFYERMSMNVIGCRTMPNDLLTPSQIAAMKTAHKSPELFGKIFSFSQSREPALAVK